MAKQSLTLPVYTADGTEAASVDLAPTVFDVTVNATLVSETLVSVQENRRRSVANSKTRGMVSGGGRKPWKQKGTGRARTGSIRGPQWRHGGVAFGPTSDRTYFRKINRKARQSVVRMLLTGLRQAGELRIIDQLSGEAFTTTKQAAGFLNQVAGEAKRPLVVTSIADAKLLKSFRNLSDVMVRSLERLGLNDLALTDQLLLDTAALGALTTRYSEGTGSREQGAGQKPSTLDPRPSSLSTKKPAAQKGAPKPSKPAANEGGTNA